MSAHRFLTLLSLTFIFMSSNAQVFTLPLYPEGQIPFAKNCELKEVHDTTNAVRISSVIVPELTVYQPSPRHRTGDAVIICPGGGYKVIVWDWEGEDIAKFWNAKGVTAIILKYRLPSSVSQEKPWLVPLSDAKRAMRLARFYAGEWDINPEHIGIMGFSAGGHLASTLSTHFDSGNPESNDPVERISCRPDFSILVYPVINMTEQFQHKGSRMALVGEDSMLMRTCSNELHVTADTPPAFLVHASDDASVPVENSLVYYRALVNNKVPAEMHIYPGGGHGFALAIGKGHLDEWPELCNTWLRALFTEKH